MIYPVEEYITITNPFSSSHHGIDLGWKDKKNQNIISVFDGVVIYQKFQKTGGYVLHIYNKELNMVAEYGHMEKWIVNLGQKIKKGQKIGVMGSSGKSTGPHLHFGLCIGSKITYTSKDKWVNPIKYLCKYQSQILSDKTKKKYKIYETKIVSGVPSEPLNVRDSKNKIVDILFNGNEIEYYGKNILLQAIVDNIRNYHTVAKYLR